MKEFITITTPTGRLVSGSPYRPYTKGADGNPLPAYKSGDNKGQPRKDYILGLAIKKRDEGHWAETIWGAKIWEFGNKVFPKHAEKESFAWKIIDGDSEIPNGKEHRPCDMQGYAGHWVIFFKNSFPPEIYRDGGKTLLTEVDAIKLGDFVQVHAMIKSNETLSKPGIFINQKYVCFNTFGPRIVLGPQADNVGFTTDEYEDGSDVPEDNFKPVEEEVEEKPKTVTPKPHYGIMTGQTKKTVAAPPGAKQVSAPPSTKKMTDKAEGTYEEYITAGWSDEQLIQHGYMVL